MDDCIFCKIVKGEIPAKIVSESSSILAFRDINPKAKVHVLIIPKKHIESLSSVENEDLKLISEMMLEARRIAKQEGIEKSGFRVVINTGSDSGNAVAHIHLHLLGGNKLGDIA
jgi:histidine triad (HIT) family protein